MEKEEVTVGAIQTKEISTSNEAICEEAKVNQPQDKNVETERSECSEGAQTQDILEVLVTLNQEHQTLDEAASQKEETVVVEQTQTKTTVVTLESCPTSEKLNKQEEVSQCNKGQDDLVQTGPLCHSKLTEASLQEANTIEENESHENTFENHPYKELLINFTPTSEQLSAVDNIEFPKTLQQTPLIDVNTKEDLEKLVTELKEKKEIGLDVEYSDHGYKALTCLVQISTKDKDYVIDTIALKNDMGILSEILVNPSIVKIFHAASNDLKWLQQDFYLFVVNMFDTQKAMRALGYQKLGLDVLLSEYNVNKDKSMQRADFRKRPLPPKYKDYARTDSHYLITFYHKLKNELIQENLLQQIFTDCNNACKVVYEVVEDGSYLSVVHDIKKMQERQLSILSKLNKWRHQVAEYLDQNTGYILSKNDMKTLVLEMPCDKQTILKFVKSAPAKERLDEILNIMLEGKAKNQFNKNRNMTFRQKMNTPKFVKNKRKFNQTDFYANEQEFAGTSKRSHQHTFHDDLSRRNTQNNFDLRKRLDGSESLRHSHNRTWFRR